MWPFKKTVKKTIDPQIKLLSNLIYAFADHNGKKYYRFPEDTAMSIERIGAINQYAIYISRGLNSAELYELLDTIDYHIYNGLGKAGSAAKIAGATYEIRLREEKICNTELLYNYLAAYYVREDEDPRIFNEQAQMEKVESFKIASNTADSFFFAMPELKALSKLSNISTENWNDFVSNSMLNNERKKEVLNILK